MLESTFTVQFTGLMDRLRGLFSRRDLCLRAEHYLRGCSRKSNVKTVGNWAKSLESTRLRGQKGVTEFLGRETQEIEPSRSMAR